MRISIPFLLCSAVLFPLGCTGSNEEIELSLRIDDTPIDREETAVVNSYSGMLKGVLPAVVSVYSQRTVEEDALGDLRRFFAGEEERMQRGVGSGVVVSPEGFVLTNNHVVEGADEIIVQFANYGQLEAEIVGRDAATDIAVLRLNGEAGREYVAAVLADSDQIEVGDVVFALGNALGIGHAVTSGIISARGRTGIGILGEEGYEDFLQTDASMNIGNSGGPLVDSWGRVVGINTAIASPGGGNVGIGFAIPINMARDVMRDLIEFGEVQRGYLGVSLRDTHPGMPVEFGAPPRNGGEDLDGARVIDVIDGSPASLAGIRDGDLVVQVNGKRVRTAGELRLEVGQRRPGTTVELGVLRDGERVSLEATLGNLEDSPDRRSREEPRIEGNELLPGVMVAPLSPEMREQLGLPAEISGLVVTEVAEGTPHAQVFPPGAVIIQINGQPAGDVENARDLVQDGRNLVVLYHQGSVHHVVVELQ